MLRRLPGTNHGEKMMEVLESYPDKDLRN